MFVSVHWGQIILPSMCLLLLGALGRLALVLSFTCHALCHPFVPPLLVPLGAFGFACYWLSKKKIMALKGSDVKNTEFQILKGIAPVIPWAK